MKSKKLILLIGLFVLPHLIYAQDGWQKLNASDNLEGWTQLGGDANYYVEGNTIIGEAVLNTPNSFLTTNKEYGDFILEFEVYMDSEINSGVQVRSESKEDYLNGRVHGYQVELDPSARAWTGGIYDEARRGWLYPLTYNEEAGSVFKVGQWNTVRVEAIGSTINTWVNGVNCSRLVDDMTTEGFIGLQVHSIDKQELKGAQIKWRNLRIRTIELEKHSKIPDPQVRQISYLKNELTDWERRRGWRMLWDGQTSNGWRSAESNQFPQSGWNIKDGILTVEETDGKEATGPGDIVTQKMFSDFELELEFKITEGANSGIKYFVNLGLETNGSAIGTEFQILDDEKHPDAQKGVAGNRTLGSLYDMIAAENLSVSGSEKPFKGVGNWNKARIISKDGHVEHWLNNQKIVEYDRFSQMFKSLVNYSKYQKWEGFGRWPEGHILLQDHGNEVSFRSIKVREL